MRPLAKLFASAKRRSAQIARIGLSLGSLCAWAILLIALNVVRMLSVTEVVASTFATIASTKKNVARPGSCALITKLVLLQEPEMNV
mmetsp:Transcript_28749/g.57899  ORF Transcript_28749/g.57899 Transcript_28749/m.57899 type:complete len:87 (+) Transcript_28749:69-329(+)